MEAVNTGRRTIYLCPKCYKQANTEMNIFTMRIRSRKEKIKK